MQPLKQLFIFPHAGGSEVSYLSLQKLLSPLFNVNIISYPGRGKRIMEPYVPDMAALVQDCISQVTPVLNGGDYFFLGHSFGALVAFENLRYLTKNKLPLPAVAFLSGRGAPSLPVSTPLKHLMSDDELVRYLNGIGGIPKELIDNYDFLSFFLPIIRNDLRLNEIYTYREEDKLPVPFVLMNGKDDTGVKPETIEAWQNETQSPVRKIEMEGNHFFILNNPSVIDVFLTFSAKNT